MHARKFKEPDENDHIATHDKLRLDLYATYSDERPLYAAVRLIAPERNVLGKRRSFHFSYIRDEQRLARGGDRYKVSPALCDWIEAQMKAYYGNMSQEERDDLAAARAEENAQRAARLDEQRRELESLL